MAKKLIFSLLTIWLDTYEKFTLKDDQNFDNPNIQFVYRYDQPLRNGDMMNRYERLIALMHNSHRILPVPYTTPFLGTVPMLTKTYKSINKIPLSPPDVDYVYPTRKERRRKEKRIYPKKMKLQNKRFNMKPSLYKQNHR